ncbi:MAG: Gfo/Idh/MocA family oxidoreductase [Nitrosopumilaceae archaeon]|uniref:Gfo/Idh/MocA family oxidoreductase n=1 Tax=Candidatus Nitrosomaritimum aestuariumsis TaxID=3342354 RepID=A0AC60VXZ6_9ARCH|nr:Gfo/Idh/MocA family oxidoreductase [Nitrosopumilaceae archaeon]
MNIVQFGLESWGQNHAKTLSDFGVLSAVFDSDLSKSKEIGQKYSVNYYDSVEQLISSESFDGAIVDKNVSIQTITDLLYDKKHVFLEKLSEINSIEFQKLKELSEKKKVVLTCGFNERFKSSVNLLREFIEQKKFGEILMLEFYRQGDLSYQNRGLIFESSINDIDIANVLIGSFPVVVFTRLGNSESKKEDFASIMLGYENNKTAIILSKGISSEKMKKMRVICSDAVLELDLHTDEIMISGQQSLGVTKRVNTMKHHIQNFIESAEGKNQLFVKPNEIINLTKIAEGALLSGKQGVPIYLDLK